MAIVAVSVAPLGEGTGVSRFVAAAEKVLRADGRVKYQLDPMFTTLEGNVADCLDVARKMHEALFTAGAVRVSTLIKIDDRRDRDVSMQDKVSKVEQLLNSED